MKKSKALLAAVALATSLLFSCARGDTAGTDARQLVAEGALLLDVRTPEEFASGHIEGAVNIPVQELEGRMAELEPKDRAIVVYCRSGARSSQAESMLEGAGYGKVHNLGPMSAW